MLHLLWPAGCFDVMWHCDVIQWGHMTSRHHAMTSHDVMCQTIGQGLVSVNSNKKTLKKTFLTWWPWPLTYDLEHQNCPRCHQGQSLYQISWPYIKRFSCESANRQTHWHTHTYTHTHTHTHTWTGPSQLYVQSFLLWWVVRSLLLNNTGLLFYRMKVTYTWTIMYKNTLNILAIYLGGKPWVLSTRLIEWIGR